MFMLPPPERPILLVAHEPATAERTARRLSARGRPRVAWLAAPLASLSWTPDLRPHGSPLVRTGREPNRSWEAAPLLCAFAARLPRHGSAIDLACGSGREVVALALRRPSVVGVDILPDALRQARRLAHAAAAPPGRIHLRRADLTDPQEAARLLAPQSRRVILCFRFLWRPLFPMIADALAPGGWLLYETFLEAQARAGRRPARASFLLQPGELRSAFAGSDRFEIVHYAEGPNARGDHLASLVARRKG